MAWVHYKDELKQFYGETENECGLCNVKTKDEMSLVRHIASVHNELKKIMENVKGKERSKGVQKDVIKMATKDENKSIDDSSDAPSEWKTKDPKTDDHVTTYIDCLQNFDTYKFKTLLYK